jgi:formate dehydrogenase iron-sulfur subunit
MTKIYIPRDMAALAMGAKRVLAAVQKEIAARGLDVEIVRNGSRGMLWLEPLVEVETPAGRIGYGPVKPSDVASLFEAGFLRAARIRCPSARSRRTPISRASAA